MPPSFDQLEFWDSRCVQLAQYTVFEEEADVQLKNKQFERPEAKS